MTEKIKLTVAAANPPISLQVAKTHPVPVEVASVIVGNPGPPGQPGPAAFISSDPGNLLATGQDGGLFAPDPNAETDPLAYYILSRS